MGFPLCDLETIWMRIIDKHLVFVWIQFVSAPRQRIILSEVWPINRDPVYTQWPGNDEAVLSSCTMSMSSKPTMPLKGTCHGQCTSVKLHTVIKGQISLIFLLETSNSLKILFIIRARPSEDVSPNYFLYPFYTSDHFLAKPQYAVKCILRLLVAS